MPGRRWFLGKKIDTTGVYASNEFFKKMQFSIPLEVRTNLALRSSAFHAGLLTIPIKVYLGAPDSISAVQAAVTAGIYAGKRWGKTKYVKLPNEKEFTTYESSTSLNIFLGINKLDLDDKNTSDDGKKFKGSVSTLSYGITYAWHYKLFTLFIAAGKDEPLTNKAEYWSLKNKLWIGIGAGFDIY